MRSTRQRLLGVTAPAAAALLGLAAGALLTEAAVLVPYWRALEPSAFLSWYAAHADLLFRFFAPLEIAAAALALAAAALEGWPLRRHSSFLFSSALLSVAVLAAFPIYFAEANASFAAGSIDPGEVRHELTLWACWHWARTVLEIGAFAAALLGLRERHAG